MSQAIQRPLGDEPTEPYSEDESRPMSPLLISSADGDILRGGARLATEDVVVVQNVVAMTCLLMSATDAPPVWMDIDQGGGKRLMAVAFDDEFVFLAFGQTEASRMQFFEQARKLHGD